jgi:hypothetical protein
MTPHCPHVSFFDNFLCDFKCELMLVLLFHLPPLMFPLLCGLYNNQVCPSVCLPKELFLIGLLRYTSFFPHVTFVDLLLRPSWCWSSSWAFYFYFLIYANSEVDKWYLFCFLPAEAETWSTKWVSMQETLPRW